MRYIAGRPQRTASGYAVYVRPGKELVLHGVPLNGLIYIGHSFRVEQRGPLQDRYSGTCSLRRTLGALLKEQFGLKAVPSGSGRAERDYISYRFTDEGEEKLTAWINETLEVRPLAFEDYLRGKRAAIQVARPVLSFLGWPNPHAAQLARLRRICSDEARAACPYPGVQLR